MTPRPRSVAVLAGLILGCGGSTSAAPDGGGGPEAGGIESGIEPEGDAGCPAAGDASVTVIAPTPYSASLVVDTANAYWTDLRTDDAGASTGTIQKVPIGGGTPSTLASLQSGFGGLALDGTSVYSVGNSAVLKFALDTGALTILASGQNIGGGIAVDEANVYWGTQSAVMKVSKSGGTPVTLVSGQSPVGIAVDSARVYWTNAGQSCEAGTCAPDEYAGSVMKAALDGGAPTALATAQVNPTAIAVDATNVYWTDEGEENQAVLAQTLGYTGSIMSVPIAGGTPAAIAARQANPVGLAVDATNVYWLNQYPACEPPNDTVCPTAAVLQAAVMAAPIAGGMPVVLVPLQKSYVQGVAAGCSWVYWTQSGDQLCAPAVASNPACLNGLLATPK